MEELISVRNVSKSFSSRFVLKGINLEVRKGEIFGLLGLNGAGKTTLIKIILKFLRPDKGVVMWKDSLLTDAVIRDKIGYLPENFFPPSQLKAIELLEGLASACTSTLPPSQLLKMVGLEKEAGRYLGFYSRGMMQRFGVALCLLKDPEVVIMDEPTLGLDIRGQRQMFDLMASLKDKGKTIIFSSHILSQVQTIADVISIVNRGRVSFGGKIEELLNLHSTKVFEEAFLKEIEKQ